MYILAGFVTALGAAAVAFALVALSGIGCAVEAITGAAAGLTGLGMFAYNAYESSQIPSDEKNLSLSL